MYWPLSGTSDECDWTQRLIRTQEHGHGTIPGDPCWFTQSTALKQNNLRHRVSHELMIWLFLGGVGGLVGVLFHMTINR